MAAENVLGSSVLIVIPDLKTPREVYSACEDARARGVTVSCPSIQEQEAFLGSLGKISVAIPYNSDNRRNVGYLMALDLGCDFIISIDDDNYCIPGSSFFEEHSIVAKPPIEQESAETGTGWFNCCELLETSPSTIYPRGFPYHARFKEDEILYNTERGQVHINEGLWLEDPDVDAISWLNRPPRVENFKNRSVLLGESVWAPINTQNTAIARKAMAAYYYVPMGYTVAGVTIERYGDIFSGYFCQACARYLGYRVRLGTPVVRHTRNPHDHVNDLKHELGCIMLLEELTDWLRDLTLDGTTYQEAYLSLADQMEFAVESLDGPIWDQATRGYFHQIAYYMRLWVEAVETIGL